MGGKLGKMSKTGKMVNKWWTNGRINGRTNGHTNGRTNGHTNGRTNGRTNDCTNGRTVLG